MFVKFSQVIASGYAPRPQLLRENCFDEDFVRCLDRFCAECNVNLGNSDREYCEFCDYSEIHMDQECPGCASGIDFHGAHLVNGEVHPNCCSLII